MTVNAAALLIAGALLFTGCGPSPQTGAPTPAANGSTAAAAPADRPTVGAADRPTGDVHFKAVLDMRQTTATFQPELRRGRIAASADWPASLFAEFTTSRGSGRCTATLIGPWVLLTAAHCVPASGIVTFAYEGQPQRYTTTCVQHPHYVSQQDASADFALCKLDRAFTAPPAFEYESVDTSAMTSLVGKRVILTGFGCVSDLAANSAQIDGRYRIAITQIDETSKSPQPHRRHVDFYAGKEENNLFTVDDPKAPNICPGDSGGPMYFHAAGGDQLGHRVVAGINSRVFYTDSTMMRYGSSLISATGGPAFAAWADDWLGNVAGVDACGLRGMIPNCRN